MDNLNQIQLRQDKLSIQSCLRLILYLGVGIVDDRIEFEHIVFKSFGIEEHCENVVNFLLSLQQARVAAKEILKNYEDFTPGEIKHILINAFNRHTRKYCYDYCEDNTRVFTIKTKDKENSRFKHSYDFAIVNNYGNNSERIYSFQ